MVQSRFRTMSNFITTTLSALSVFECKVLPALQKAAHLVYLLTLLALAFIAEYAPKAGKFLGKLCGKVYRAGHTFGLKYGPTLYRLASTIEYKARVFISEQLGSASAYSQIKYAIVPAVCVTSEVSFIDDVMNATRNQLFAYAKALEVTGYNRLKTEDLRAQLIQLA
ncbi:MAG: hypothetical protein ACO29Y_06000 [Holophagaceae bacterium]